MSSTHRGTTVRDPRDFYRTPFWCVEGVYKAHRLPTPTLDPCAGDGALLEAILQLRQGRGSRYNLAGIEKTEELTEAAREKGLNVNRGDGLDRSWVGEHVIMNPPYGEAEKWVEKAAEEATSALILLRLGYLSSKKRHGFWTMNRPRALFILSKRPSFTEDGKSDSADYCWVYFDKQSSMFGTHMAWIV